MCGIAGGVSLDGRAPLDEASLTAMLAMLRHRGPDAAGAWIDATAALGHARLSIIDLAGGLQPLSNEDGSVWVAVNGEIYNYPEITDSLRCRGHVMSTRSDSEVVAHLYEDYGPRLLDQLNGQFAFALWDARRRRLMLARDRVGVRPLFYTIVDGALLFGSEIKALLADRRVGRRTDLRALDQVFTYWAPLPGRTMFEGIYELPPGHYLLAGPGLGVPRPVPYWDLDFGCPAPGDSESSAEELRSLLIDATRLRLRADVPVGAYLSGGLDSSAIASIARRYTTNELQTFAVTFEDTDYDERRHQQRMVKALGTSHHVVECRHRDIGAVFPDVVWHAEVPLLRTAPAPLFLLSDLVRQTGLKVVLTGEGADEMLAGYDIFKETLVRRFWARAPQSNKRAALLGALYGWIPQLSARSAALLTTHLSLGLHETEDVAYSHLPRWRSTSRLKRLFSHDVKSALAGYDSREELDDMLQSRVHTWDHLSKAQYIETRTFLSSYLLSSQGDRVAMAHAVEGRFPFLDHRVIELAARIPPSVRLPGLNEKAVLKRAVAGLVPEEIRRRPKQPYRAPTAPVFAGTDRPGYVDDLLGSEALDATGLFDADGVDGLRAKCSRGRPVTETDAMALVGVVSAQLWHQLFMSERPSPGRETFRVLRLDTEHPWKPNVVGATSVADEGNWR